GLLAGRLGSVGRAVGVRVVRVMLVAVVLQGLAGVMTAALYARRRVTLPAFAVAVYNLGIIVTAILWYQLLGVYALVLGVVIGAAGQLLIQIPGVGRLHFRPRLALRSP